MSKCQQILSICINAKQKYMSTKWMSRLESFEKFDVKFSRKWQRDMRSFISVSQIGKNSVACHGIVRLAILFGNCKENEMLYMGRWRRYKITATVTVETTKRLIAETLGSSLSHFTFLSKIKLNYCHSRSYFNICINFFSSPQLFLNPVLT